MNATFYLNISFWKDKKDLKVFVIEWVLYKESHSENYYENGKYNICDGELFGIEALLKKNII